MQKKIALEEHFMAPGMEDYFARTAINISPDLFGKALDALKDFGERRLCAMDTIGVDRIMFPVDYPFEHPDEAGEWIESAPLPDAEREAVCHGNARALPGLR